MTVKKKTTVIAVTYPIKFTIGDVVEHAISKGRYTITILPLTGRLEKTGEPAYSYIDRDGTIWHRGQAEMEDGRFTLVP